MFKKNILIIFVRSLLFTILFYINTVFLILFTIIKRIFLFNKNVDSVSFFWAKSNVILLKYICGIKYNVINENNIPKNMCLIVSKHQSTWETYFLYQYFKIHPIFVLKKELLKIPFIGYALKNVGCIAIDRTDGISALKKMEENSKKIIENKKRNIIIFPQGTRVPINSTTNDYPYKGGFINIAKNNKLDILPVSLNSANCWPKGSFLKYPGIIEVKFLNPLKYSEYENLQKNEIIKIVENTIENGQKSLKNV